MTESEKVLELLKQVRRLTNHVERQDQIIHHYECTIATLMNYEEEEPSDDG